MPTMVSAFFITGYGTDCEVEYKYAIRFGGDDKNRIIFFFQLISGEACLLKYNFLVFLCGFLDDGVLDATLVSALFWKHAKTDGGKAQVNQLAKSERSDITPSICNGFKLMIKLELLSGLLAEGDSAVHTLAMDCYFFLAHNDSIRHDDRCCSLKRNPASPSAFTRRVDTLYQPVRLGKGKFTAQVEATMQRNLANNLVNLQYLTPVSGEVTQDYPQNPNGSPYGIESICDSTGRLFGLMLHPEAFNHITDHPHWSTLKNPKEITLGVSLFTKGVRYDVRGEQ